MNIIKFFTNKESGRDMVILMAALAHGEKEVIGTHQTYGDAFEAAMDSEDTYISFDFHHVPEGMMTKHAMPIMQQAA